MASDLQAEIERTAEMARMMRTEYENSLSDEMSQLHNQFIAFIVATQVPLPHVLMVLEMLKAETLDQARKDYLKDD